MAWFTRSFRALLWRNAIYRKRRWLPSLIEFFLPALCVAALYFIKLDLQSDENSSLKSVVVPASYPGRDQVIIPLSFQDYLTAIQANRTCVADPTATPLEKLLGLAPLVISGLDYLSWPVPFVFCNSYACQRRGEDATDYCTYRTLALAPESADSAGATARMLSFKDYVEQRYLQLISSALPFEYDLIQIFDSNDELNEYVTSDTYGTWVDGQYSPKVAIGVVFGDGGEKTYEYTLRTNSTNFNSQEQSAQPVARTTPTTERVFDPYKREDGGSCSSPGAPSVGKYSGSCTGQYMLNGAVTVQRLIDDWILSDSGVDATVSQNGAVFLPFPTKEYTKSGFYENISPFAPLLFTLGLLYPVASTIRSVVLEKELRQKELMKMMSVTECDIGWSWFVSFYAFFAPSGVITAIFTNLLYSSSAYIWLFIFWQFTFIACIVYCFFIAAISTKATRATLIGIMLFFVGYFLPFVVNYQDGSAALITLLSLHPVTAYTYGLIMMGYLEDSGVGVQTTTVGASEFPSGYSFANSLGMLLFDSIFWGLVTWYLNRILRGDYGTALKWYFPFTRQYWCPKKVVAADQVSSLDTDNEGIPMEDIGATLKSQQSQDNANVHIHGLRKQFGEKTAVDGLNLSMYSGQITALLGHNGAGKTTTINMLTGMVPPTSGYATVAGYDIRTDLSLLRENVGTCLQHDCLFPQLTVQEHIVFFSRVKGVRKPKEEFQQSVTKAIEDVALLEKRHSFAKDLSGGMKRKLSVAIAFCGNSKVVFLDEPTSGMDPFSRRFTWNVIRQYREDRCIILTTHFLDEADLLGDRIAIMAEGQLRCCGSPLFLKKQYGVGYQLTIIKNQASASLEQEEESKEDEVDTSLDLTRTLNDIVTGAVPSAKVLSDAGTEMSFQLPLGESAAFLTVFEKLDEQAAKGTIETYGVSVTTLDEVFLMVARGEEGLLSSERKPTETVDKDVEESNVRSYRQSLDATERGGTTFQRHCRALFLKRALNFKRDKKAWCCSTIIPTMVSFFGFLIVYIISRRNPNYPTLTLSLDQNNPEIVVDRNPIPFNDPGVYDCQPGQCLYEGSTVNVTETSELYYFCGANAQVDPPSSNATTGPTTCTIEDSSSIISQITQNEAFGVGSDVSDVLNSSKSVFNTSYDYDASQYGAVFFTHDEGSVTSNDGSTFDENVIQSCAENPGSYTTAEQCEDFGGIGYIVNYNFTSLHSSLLYQAKADEALLRHYRNDDTEYGISVSVWPLPLTQVEETYALASNSFAAWFLLVLSFPFIAGSFATFIVAERESKAKHLQTVAGVKPSAYWLSTYLWDFINYQIPLWTVIALMYALNVEAFVSTERHAASSTFALLILFGPAAAGFTYILCFSFKSPSMANLFVIVFNFFIGMAGPLVCLILRLLAADPATPRPDLKNAAVALEWVLRLIPSFCLGKGLLNTVNISFFEFVEAKPLTVWSPTIALYEVIFLGIESVLYIFLTIRIDVLSTKPKAVARFKKAVDCLTCKCLCRGKKNHEADEDATVASEDDEDVAFENERVQSGQADSDLVVLNEMTKDYPNGKRAVDHVSLGIQPGECFALLGINGAGKTTTMAMLTAEFPPTEGDAHLAGYSVSSEPEQTRRRVGYCPQFDAHFANMTGSEHIELYAIIKGVPRDLLKEVVASKLKEVGLNEFDSKRLSSGYSGGMKRKLSVACATIGSPQIVFLDEPSTGMDPVARRDLWKVISRMVNGRSDMLESDKTSVILTTHSMEEAEALCPRLGIMAGGKLRCLGSAQHLKNRFGTGYQIEAKVQHPHGEDSDVITATRKMLAFLEVLEEDIEALDLHELASDTTINLEQAKELCIDLAGGDHLANMLSVDHPHGYHVAKLAESPVGITVDELVGFCVEELRVKALIDFFESSYESAVLRERQDVKVRFEISSDGVTISSVFANIEEHKEELMMDDYGVSQTSLEQIFNDFAAAAEKEKLEDSR